MSKGTIVSDLGSGEYVVRLGYDLTRAQQKIDALTAEIAELQTEISGLQNKYDEAASDLTLAANLLTNAINGGETSQISQAQGVWIEKLGISQRALSVLQIAKVKVLTKQKKKAFIENNIPNTSATATIWCADFTEGLSGDVGVIDLGAEQVVQPGWNETPTPESYYSAARDGAMTPPESFVSGSGLYRAMALYDGWELFKPTYRTGVITSISADTCSVDLDALETRYVKADANREVTGLNSVQINYMDCNGAVFGTGDRVVVAFLNQDPSSAQVVGFVTNPLPCVVHGVLATYGKRDVQTAEDTQRFLFMHSDANGWVGRTYNAEIENERMEWLGPKNGLGEYEKYLVIKGTRVSATVSAFGPDIIQDGKVVATGPRNIMGAGIATYNGDDYFVIVTLDNASIWQATADVFWKLRTDDPGGTWQEIGQMPHSAYGLDATYHHLFPSPESTAYFFSESAFKAIKLQRAAKVPDPQHSYVDNPAWETEVPETSSFAGGGRAQHYREAWLARNQYEGSPIRREAYVVEVTIDSDLAGLTYTVDEDIPTVTESGPRPVDWVIRTDLAQPEYQTHTVTSESLHLVDYIGNTKTELKIQHTAYQQWHQTLVEGGFSEYTRSSNRYIRTSSTSFLQDGVEMFSCSHDFDQFTSEVGELYSDRIANHSIADLIGVDLRFNMAIIRQVDLTLNEHYEEDERNGSGGGGVSGTQSVDYLERVIIKTIGSPDIILASESINDSLSAYDETLFWNNQQPPFDRLLGYDSLETGLGEVVVSPGSGSWPEFAGKPGIGYSFFGDLGADLVSGGGAVYVTKSGEMFVGALAESRSILKETGAIKYGEMPYPRITIVPFSDGAVDDARVEARGYDLAAAYVFTPGSSADAYASIPAGWIFKGASMV